jgi:hypothetical protein
MGGFGEASIQDVPGGSCHARFPTIARLTVTGLDGARLERVAGLGEAVPELLTVCRSPPARRAVRTHWRDLDSARRRSTTAAPRSSRPPATSSPDLSG